MGGGPVAHKAVEQLPAAVDHKEGGADHAALGPGEAAAGNDLHEAGGIVEPPHIGAGVGRGAQAEEEKVLPGDRKAGKRAGFHCVHSLMPPMLMPWVSRSWAKMYTMTEGMSTIMSPANRAPQSVA